MINGKIIIDEDEELYNTIIGELENTAFEEPEEGTYLKYEKHIKSRPHEVLLGAGASMAALPKGDKFGRKISAMAGFIQKLEMNNVISSVKLTTKSENLEDIYMKMYDREDCKQGREELENMIYE